MRLKEKKYTAGEIDSRWSEAIKADFMDWLNKKKDLPMSKAELDAYLEDRNW